MVIDLGASTISVTPVWDGIMLKKGTLSPSFIRVVVLTHYRPTEIAAWRQLGIGSDTLDLLESTTTRGYHAALYDSVEITR